MANLDRQYLSKLKQQYAEVASWSIQEQSEKFKLRYVLTLGEEVLAVDDRAMMFEQDLRHGESTFEYNDPNLNKYLEKCQVAFESFLVRNQQFDIFSPHPGKTQLTFIQFLLHQYKDMIMTDFTRRWKLKEKAKKKVMSKPDHFLQAVLSEFLDQPPFGIDHELDALTKQERETKVNHSNRVTKLEKIVQASEHKAVRSVQEKRAIHELESLEQGDIEQEVNIIRANINKLARKLMLSQKQALQQIADGTFGNSAAAAEINANYVLPEPWEEFIDENTNAPYYFNPSTGQTQWTRP